MTEEFVTVYGKTYHIENNILNLLEIEISDISEIKGLDILINLQIISIQKISFLKD